MKYNKIENEIKIMNYINSKNALLYTMWKHVLHSS